MKFLYLVCGAEGCEKWGWMGKEQEEGMVCILRLLIGQERV
jgi:hypothetical protein